MRPGQTINLDKLEKTLGKSRTPIRAALIALECEGLISRSGRSYSVVFLNKQEINDLYVVRRVIEAEAAKISATICSAESIYELKSILLKIGKTIKKPYKDPIKIADMSGNFHKEIVASTGNLFMCKYAEQIRTMLRIVRVSLYTSMERSENDMKEHAKVLDAIEMGDPKRAWKEMYNHETRVLEYVNQNVIPKLF